MTSWMFFPCVRLLVWFRRTQPPVHSGWTTTNPALYGGAHVDGSIFAPSRFLISSKSCLFPGFFKTSPVFLVSSKPRLTNVVVTRWFSSDLSVCTLPTDRCDHARFSFSLTIGSHADAISLLHFHCQDRILLIFLLLLWLYSICSIPPADIHYSLFVLEGGVLRDD